jgi:multidrug efflux pump subunit AcrA (membrane-fusion protein)
MSANASIVVDEIDDVLIVPNWAVRLDRETGNAYVNRVGGRRPYFEVTITTGLRNEQFSEVLSGLSSGDVVVVTSERSTFSFFGGIALVISELFFSAPLCRASALNLRSKEFVGELF